MVYSKDFRLKQRYEKHMKVKIIGCAVDKCTKCDKTDANTCIACPDDCVFKNYQCRQIYDEITVDFLMFSIMSFTYIL